MKFGITVLAAVAVIGLCAAKWARPDTAVPVDRLIKTAESRLKSSPKDPELNYLLGRLYSLAFAKNDSIEIYGSTSDKPRFPAWQTFRVSRESQAKLTPADVKNLSLSLDYYWQASHLAPQNSLYLFGYAWMLHQAAPYASSLQCKVAKLPKTKTVSGFVAESLKLYRMVYQTAKFKDLSENGSSMDLADSYLSREAGKLILSLGQKPGNGGVSAAEKQDIEATIEKINNRPKAITPIIFPVDGGGYDGLINENANAKFDLSGFNDGTKWPWVTKKAGILCWDPENSGKITSGRQLFGTSTFWMFFKDGYAALASLDDDENGWLEGKEFKGISVWIDRNENAVSDQGEVIPASSYGITRINTQLGDTFNSMPVQLNGIHLKNGANLPTYDWLPISQP